jgi:CO/xanthine dehydrogenase Mo-binding subunit
MNILARDKVLYDGHAVAAVAATDRHTAEEALRLIEVEYEVLPPVMKVEEAMRADAPIVLEDLRNKEEGPDKPTNVANHLQFKRGDIEKGFKAADYIVEREFDTAMVHQGYVEPHNAVAVYSSDGHATIYCSSQGPFAIRSLTAQVLKMPEGNIKVVPAEIGGGFGGKLIINCLSRTAGGSAVQENRTASKAGHDPSRGLARHGTDFRFKDPLQTWCDQGRETCRRRNLDGVRGRCFSRVAGRSRRDDDCRVV